MATRPAPGFLRFTQESWQELRKVTWPSRETVIRLTVIVLIISAIVAAYILLFDNVFHFLVDRWVLNTPETTPAPLPVQQ